MASRDTELRAFVDERGTALMRTASLLALDDADVVLVDTLARTARRWRDATRDDDVERYVRNELYDVTVARWRRTGGLDGDDPDPADETEPPARRLLRTLTRRERAVLVLRSFEGLDADEVAVLLRMKAADVEQLLTSTARRLSDASGTTTSTLLRDAARTEVPPRLVDEALADAGSRGRRVGWVAAAVVLALVVAGALLARTQPAPEASEPDPNLAAWGIPSTLPLATDLPDLAERPVDQASAAYLVEGVPVLVDADTGDASTVFRGSPSPEWFDGSPSESQSALLGRAGRWTDLALSPDGRTLLLVQTPLPGVDGERSWRLFTVDVASGAVERVPGLAPVNREGRFARAQGASLAWAPDSEAFACACAGSLTLVRMDASQVIATSWPATDVAWGGVGVAAQASNGEWALIDAGGELRLDTISFSDVLAMSATRPPQYLTATTGTIYSLAGDAKPDGARCVLWDENVADPVPVTPIPDRDGPLCTPVLMQPGRSAFVMVIRSTLPRPQPPALDVIAVDVDGSSIRVGVLPPGTQAASFAGTLVG